MNRVLLLDDHPAIGVILTAYARDLGYSDSLFEQVAGAEEALARLRSGDKFDLILLDNSAPPTFHFRGALNLLAEHLGDVPVVLFTGFPPHDFGADPVDARIAFVFEKDNLSPTSLQDVLGRFGIRPH